MVYWKKYDKVEKEHRKRAEKEAMEQRKLDDELVEVCMRVPTKLEGNQELQVEGKGGLRSKGFLRVECLGSNWNFQQDSGNTKQNFLS